MISIREVETIVRGYPADMGPRRIEPLGMAGGMSGAQFWRIESPRGPLVVRQWPVEHPSAERLRFIHDVLFHAARRGVTFLAVPIRTTAGESFVTSGGHLWEMAPWMPGAADYEVSPTTEKLRAAMKSLAIFHQAVSDFDYRTVTTAASQRLAGATAPARHFSRLNELAMNGIYELRQSITDTVLPEMAPLAQQFVAALSRSVPRVLRQLEPIARIELPTQPCLRDIWHDHVLFTGDEVTGIIDYGALEIDTPATDVARLLGSLVGDDEVKWSAGVRAYSEERTLSTEEEETAKALDASGTILAGCNWLRWIYIERRQFENRAQLIERFRRIVARSTRS